MTAQLRHEPSATLGCVSPEPSDSDVSSTLARLRMALVHDWLLGMRGGEKCLELLAQQFPKAPLYTLFWRPGATSAAIESRPIHASPLNRLPGVRHYYRWLLPLMPHAARSWRLPRQLDMVVSFSHSVAQSVRVPSGVPHISYCFTPMRYAWDLRQEYFGKQPIHPLRQARDRFLDALCQWDRETAQKVTQFVACSRTIQERIRRVYDRDSQVIYPPVDIDFYRPDDGPREDYYLCVSALVPYKRIDLAIDACRQLRRRLLIIGTGPEAQRLARRAPVHVEWLGWRGNQEIRWHLQRCRALLFPGHEDFGIVPVEAQACGAPVIAYGRGGATETIVPSDGTQPGSGLFFHEPRAEALAETIERFERQPAGCDPQVARASAQRFSAARYQRDLLGLIASVAGRSAV